MGRPLLRRSRPRQHRRTQQRMAEAQLRAVTHQHAAVLGLVQCGGNVQSLPDQRRRHRGGGTRAVERQQQYGAPGRCGQAGSCSAYTTPRRSPTGSASGSGAAPTRWASLSRRAISRMPSGLPPVSSTKRSTTPSARRSGTRSWASVAGQAGEGQDGHSLPRTGAGSSRFAPPTGSTPGRRGGDEPQTRGRRPTRGRPIAGRRPAPAPAPVRTPRRAGTAPPRPPESARKRRPPAPTRRRPTARWPGRRVSRPTHPGADRAPAAAPRGPVPIRTRLRAPKDTGSRWPSARRTPAGWSSRCPAHPVPPAWSSRPRASPRAGPARGRVRRRDRPPHSPRWGISPTRTTAHRCHS